ncbi:MAG: hypothetical protein JWP18_2091 [Solirubrobacterales bacterium]|nr:hypothetical protein [Solirubrobacterales bacterium]
MRHRGFWKLSLLLLPLAVIATELAGIYGAPAEIVWVAALVVLVVAAVLLFRAADAPDRGTAGQAGMTVLGLLLALVVGTVVGGLLLAGVVFVAFGLDP